MTAWINLMPNGRYALLAPHESLPKLYREIATFATHQEAKVYAKREFIPLVERCVRPKDSIVARRPDYGEAQPKSNGRATYLHWRPQRREWRYMMGIPQELRPILGRTAFLKTIGSMPYQEAQKLAYEIAAEDRLRIKKLRAELKLSQDRAASASACDAP